MSRLFGRTLRRGVADVLDSAYGASNLENRLRGALASARYDQMLTSGRYNRARAAEVESDNANYAQLLANMKEPGHKFNMVDAALAGRGHMGDAVKAHRGLGEENRLVDELERLKNRGTPKSIDYRSGAITGSNRGQIGAGRLSETKAGILRENEDALTTALGKVKELGIDPETKEGQSLLVEIMARGKPVSGSDVKNVLTTKSAVGLNEAKIQKFTKQAESYKTLSDLKAKLNEEKITDMNERRKIEENFKQGKLKVLEDTAKNKGEYWDGRLKLQGDEVLNEKEYMHSVVNIKSLEQQSKDQFRKTKAGAYAKTQASLAKTYDSKTALNDQKAIVEQARKLRIDMARDLDAGKLEKVESDLTNSTNKIEAEIRKIEQQITSGKIKDSKEIANRKLTLEKLNTELVLQEKHYGAVVLTKAKLKKVSAEIEKLKKQGLKIDWEMMGGKPASGDSLLNNFTKLYSEFMKENEIVTPVYITGEDGEPTQKIDYENSIYFNELSPQARTDYVSEKFMALWKKSNPALAEAMNKIEQATGAEAGVPQNPVGDTLASGVPGQPLGGQPPANVPTGGGTGAETGGNPVADELNKVQGQQPDIAPSNIANQTQMNTLQSFAKGGQEGHQKLRDLKKQAEERGNTELVNIITQIMQLNKISPTP